MVILDLFKLFLISITSYAAFCDHFSLSPKALSHGPKLSSSTHLQNNFVERPPRWAKHYVSHSCIKRPSMTGTSQTPAGWIKINRTSCVGTSSAVSLVLAVARSQ